MLDGINKYFIQKVRSNLGPGTGKISPGQAGSQCSEQDTLHQSGEVSPGGVIEPAAEMSREGADCAGEAGVAGALAGTPAQQPKVQVGRLVTLVVQPALVAPHSHPLSLCPEKRNAFWRKYTAQ
jgi:hypothetical protein